MSSKCPSPESTPTTKMNAACDIKGSSGADGGRAVRREGYGVPFCESENYPGSGEVDWGLTRSLWAGVSLC